LLNDIQNAEVVITAPQPHAAALAYATRSRATLGVLVGLFVDAERSIAIAAPYIQTDILDGGVLGAAMTAALERKVVVELLTTNANLANPRIRKLFSKFGPLLRLYSPEFPEFEKSELGSHAKFCICDDTAAYVGSANLTKPGLGGHVDQSSGHFELGILVRGRAAAAMRNFWDFAVHHKLFRPYEYT
jgi:phosphatidylserine/phosphatidylglycerophosphate/cardiolipin synthase-like enzyme